MAAADREGGSVLLTSDSQLGARGGRSSITMFPDPGLSCFVFTPFSATMPLQALAASLPRNLRAPKPKPGAAADRCAISIRLHGLHL